jgi:predicted AAA+ superfamily ATPase
VRDDHIRQLLTEACPWWRAGAARSDPLAWVSADRVLTGRARYDLGYRTAVLADFATAPIGDTLAVLRGPRRVGKSVALRDLAATLLTRPDIEPHQVLYLACDGMNAQDLTRALRLGRELTRHLDIAETRPRVWLLDEVTAVKGWTATLKRARDATPFGDDTVIATGSSWRTDEDVEGHLLAGRAGTSGLRRVRQLMPMSFREYLATARPHLARLAPIHPAQLQQPNVANTLDEIRFDVDEYDLAWQAYLTCGGFPRAVTAVERTGAHDLDYLQDLAAWLRRDIDPDAPAESVPLLIAGLSTRATSPLDVAGTAAALGYPSRKVFDLRLNRLVGCFAAIRCPHRDERGQRIANAQAKTYLTDPVLAWLAPLLRAGLPSPDFTALTEQAIAVAAARALDDLEPGRWIAEDTIGYVRTASGQEVDLAPVPAASPAGTLVTVPMESKWVDRGWRSEAKVLEGKYTRGILATKTLLDLTHPTWAVPAPVVALLLT